MGRKLRVFLDSDIFIRDLRFKRDEHYHENANILQIVKEKRILGYTSIYNLLEICGYLSFNLDPTELKNLYSGFPGRYALTILFPDILSEQILKFNIPIVFSYIEKKMALSDSIVSDVADMHRNGLDIFITWNAKHFKDKLNIRVLSPNDFLEEYEK